ncbi:hypothetical protein Tco_0760555 [Tanacetum coccineum]
MLTLCPLMTYIINLRVFEQELTSTLKSSASAQNVALFHTDKISCGFADEVIYSLFAKQSKDLDLLHEDLEQIDDIDIEEMDINWQIAMIAIRMKKFYKMTGRRFRMLAAEIYSTRDSQVLSIGRTYSREEVTNQALLAFSSNLEAILSRIEGVEARNAMVEVYKTRLKDVASFLAVAAEEKKNLHIVPSFLTME